MIKNQYNKQIIRKTDYNKIIEKININKIVKIKNKYQQFKNYKIMTKIKNIFIMK